MILWLALFLLVVAISFVLAFQSMKDYQEIPHKSNLEYALFLIRQPSNFNAKFLEALYEQILKEGLIVSVERLFKGRESALVIFGPKKILLPYQTYLNLLELEDYSMGINKEEISVWEVGTKSDKREEFLQSDSHNIFKTLPQLLDNEQFWWQIILAAKKGKDGKKLFQTQIRAVVYSKDHLRRKQLSEALHNMAGELSKVPKPFSTDQIAMFYHLRSLGKDSSGPILTADQVIKFLTVS